MPVITLSRQFGAGGQGIGRSLAERFDAEYLDREVVALAAARLGIPEAEAEGYDERLPGLWQRVVAALTTSAPEVSMPPLPADVASGPVIGERLAALTRAVIEEAADRGNAVILGRGGGYILRDRPAVLRVQLHASLDARVANVMARVEEAPPDVAADDASLRDLCRRVDGARARYIKSRFGADWNDTRNYDLSIDTGRVGFGRAVDLIETAARHVSATAS
jgi:cytidylate kinase